MSAGCRSELRSPLTGRRLCLDSRRGLQLRSAARAAAEKAVKDEQQARLDSLRRQMAEYKKKAAEAKQVRGCWRCRCRCRLLEMAE